MRKRILHNWTLKLASLILAALLWFVVVQFNDPKDTKTLNNIQVNLINQELLENENKVYEVIDDSDIVSVTVRAPKSVIGQLRASDIVAEADVSRLTDINTVAITYTLQNVTADYSIEGNHDVVKLNVEDKASKLVQVAYETVGEVAEGYVVSKVTPDLNAIEVSGPKSVMDTISYASVQIDVTGFKKDMSAYVDIVFYDKDNNPVDAKNIQKNVNYVRMVVEVLAVKEVPVEVNYMGVPEAGYMATGETISDPATVLIAGQQSALTEITKISIPEERLNITGANEDLTDIVNIKDYLPENVKFGDSTFSGKVTATVKVEQVKDKTIEVPESNIQFLNVPEGYEVELQDENGTLNLEVSGIAEAVNSLDKNRIYPQIDVSKWMEDNDLSVVSEGTHSLPITFRLPDGVKIKHDLTARVVFTKAEEN